MPRIRAIFFDLDATLLDYGEPAYRETVGRVTRQLSKEFPGIPAARLAASYLTVNDAPARNAAGQIATDSRGRTDGRSIWREAWRRALAAVGCPEEAALTRAVTLYEQDRCSSYRLFEDSLAALAALHRLGVTAAIVTNGPAFTQDQKIIATGLRDHVRATVVSGEVGVAKPRAEIFRIALEAVGATPAEVWHVGDSLVTDVAGARRAELAAAVWLNRSGTRRPAGPTPDHEIESLAKLVDLLATVGSG